MRRWPWIGLVGVMVVLILSAGAPGMIIHGDTSSTSNPAAHYLAPIDDPGWGHVGSVGTNAGTGVYVGNGYVLTAFHVGADTFTLNGTPYTAEPGTTIRLTNPDSSNADLILYRLASDPGLPMLSIGSSTLVATTDVIMIGSGRDRGSALKNYSFGSPPATETFGYDWATGRSLVWGSNTIFDTHATNPALIMTTAFGTTYSFRTVFDPIDGEGQAADKDSGGGVFAWNGGEWELIGIIWGTQGYESQPANTSMFGQTTVIADLSIYNSQIMAVIPEPGMVALLAPGLLLVLRRRRGQSC